MAAPKQKKYVTFPELSERWNCHPMTIERLSREDPDFPEVMRLRPGGMRRVEEDALAKYEAGKVVKRSA